MSEDEIPPQKAAEQLRADGVDVLHTIGGDDTNTTAADLAAYLRSTTTTRPSWPAQDDRQRRCADPPVLVHGLPPKRSPSTPRMRHR